MNKDLIKRLKDDPYFKEFLEFVISKMDEFDSVSGLVGMSNEEAGEAARVRAKSLEILKEILSPLLNYNEKREPTEKEIDAAKTKVGL